MILRVHLTLLAAALALAPLAPRAADDAKPETQTSAETPEKAKKKGNSDRLPFRGKIKSVDAAKMTITLAGQEKDRVVHVTSQTKIVMAGKPAVFGDIKAGEEVGGQGKKRENGELEATSLRVGPRPEAAGAKKKAPAEKPAEPEQ
ncbi:MAG: hypothetical protein ACKVYV_14655 [Limisphaerales bacterium]